MLSDISETVFFTGVGLNTWAQVGNLNRELEIYKRIRPHLREINLVTYGGQQDLHYTPDCGDLNLLSNPWLWNAELTKYIVYYRHHSLLKQTDIFKTNQIIGAEIPLWIKTKLGKKLIVRCGYLISDFMRKRGADTRTIARYVALERNSFQMADAGIVTSSWQREVIVRNYQLPPEKIHVIPNYVITDLFRPIQMEKTFDLIYVGRCGAEKNVDGLFQAMNLLKKRDEPYCLLMVGGCSRDIRIRKMASDMELNVVFQDNIPNSNLPDLLNRSKIFMLPSFHEGHPKSLLEAMSCGRPCIGSNVEGIREDIRHEETGYLSSTDPEQMANAIHDVMSDEELQKKIGLNARQYIKEKYSIDNVLQKEINLIESVMSK